MPRADGQALAGSVPRIVLVGGIPLPTSSPCSATTTYVFQLPISLRSLRITSVSCFLPQDLALHGLVFKRQNVFAL